MHSMDSATNNTQHKSAAHLATLLHEAESNHFTNNYYYHVWIFLVNSCFATIGTCFLSIQF